MTQELASGPDPRFLSNTMASFVRIGALVLLLSLCYRIISPFINIVIWAIIISVAIYPAHRALTTRFGGREKTSAVLLVLVGVAVILGPAWLLTDSTLISLRTLAENLREGSIAIPAPAPKVADWPMIGDKVYEIWGAAAANLQDTLNQFSPQLRKLGQRAVAFAGDMAIGVLQFVLSIVIAGALLTAAAPGYRSAREIAVALVGEERGPGLIDLAIGTTRSVFQGVLGIAFVQAVLAGLGLVVMDVPAAGLLAGAVLVLAIVQLPPIIVLAPVAVWVFSVAAPVPATIFAVYSFVVSILDTFLKPLLLGRGVSVPMLVILLGAIGGAITTGFIGLFVGAVVLALGYEILMAWMRAANEDRSGAPAETA